MATTTTSKRKTKANVANVDASKQKKRKVANQGHTKGKVDPASGLVTKTAKIYESNGSEMDAMLCFVDGTSDKYYIVQVIQKTKKEYYCFTRWGRTGTRGQSQLFGPFNKVDEAVKEFEKKFKAKTGNTWEDEINGKFKVKKGKYVKLESNTDPATYQSKKEGIIWQYYVSDGVDDKKNGWYDYDADASDVVEGLYNARVTNPNLASYLSVRNVNSGYFEYDVDLTKWSQMNTTTKKVRNIRRMNKITSKVTDNAEELDSDEEEAEEVKYYDKDDENEEFFDVDPMIETECNCTGLKIVAPFSATLNQTNIGQNNNKFYKIQLIEDTSHELFVGTRWGRVGEDGSAAIACFAAGDMDGAVKEFKKKFKSKTTNDWDDRDNFQHKKGKYDLIKMDTSEAAASPSPRKVKVENEQTEPSKLDKDTQDLIELVFDSDMFKEAMKNMELDVKKLPLGALSSAQIQSGYNVLSDIEKEIKRKGGPRKQKLEELSSNFYTVIPHSFGRQRPPVLSTMSDVQNKYDSMAVLSDIEAAQGLVEDSSSSKSNSSKKQHPVDALYETLTADLKLVQNRSKEFQHIKKYSRFNGFKLRKVWSINRNGEDKRFGGHQNLSNRRLLWHGTNIAVAAAIIKSGLRIMPHSGGRVGSGIYLASMQEKSAQYTCGTNWKGKHPKIMFLVEAALGKEHCIYADDPSLAKAPSGFDSVVAVGTYDADPSANVKIEIDGKEVVISSGKPINSHLQSSFHHSEYLIYRESQHRLRYVLVFD